MRAVSQTIPACRLDVLSLELVEDVGGVFGHVVDVLAKPAGVSAGVVRVEQRAPIDRETDHMPPGSQLGATPDEASRLAGQAGRYWLFTIESVEVASTSLAPGRGGGLPMMGGFLRSHSGRPDPLDAEAVERPHDGNLSRPPHGEARRLALDPPRDDKAQHDRVLRWVQLQFDTSVTLATSSGSVENLERFRPPRLHPERPPGAHNRRVVDLQPRRQRPGSTSASPPTMAAAAAVSR